MGDGADEALDRELAILEAGFDGPEDIDDADYFDLGFRAHRPRIRLITHGDKYMKVKKDAKEQRRTHPQV